jgi:hypothetical protein
MVKVTTVSHVVSRLIDADRNVSDYSVLIFHQNASYSYSRGTLIHNLYPGICTGIDITGGILA